MKTLIKRFKKDVDLIEKALIERDQYYYGQPIEWRVTGEGHCYFYQSDELVTAKYDILRAIISVETYLKLESCNVKLHRNDT